MKKLFKNIFRKKETKSTSPKIRRKNAAKACGVSLSITEITDAKSRLKIPFMTELVQILLVFIASVGTMFTFSSILKLYIGYPLVAVMIFIFSAIFVVGLKLCKKRRLLLCFGATLLALVIAGAFYKTVYTGGLALFEQAMSAISRSMYWDEVRFTNKWHDTMYPATNLVFSLLSLIVTGFLAYFLTVKPSFLAIFLLTFPFFEIGAAFGCVPDYLWFSIMIGTWAAALTLRQAAHIKRRGHSTTGKSSAARAGVFAGSAVLAIVLTIGLFFGGRALLNSLGFTRAKNVEQLRTYVKDTADDWYDLMTGVDRDGSLKEGKLLEIDDHKVKDRTYFKLEATMQELKYPLYIKGYTATQYAGTQWEQSDAYDDNKALFEKLDAYSYRLAGINGVLLDNHDEYATFDKEKVTFSDFRRLKDYTFELGSPVYDESYSAIYDYSLKSKNNKTYSYETYTNPEDVFKIVDSDFYKNKIYSNVWQQYCRFVRKELIKPTENEKILNTVKDLDTSDVYTAVDSIRAYLDENIDYTFIVNKYPSDSDFVEELLFSERSGYSTHYATAATVMLQAAGYPARYVEGYYINPESYRKEGKAGKYGYVTMNVTDRFAHAWVEVFDDNFGWVRADVTPGFYTGSMKEYMEEFMPDPPEEETPPEENKPENENDQTQTQEPEVDDSLAPNISEDSGNIIYRDQIDKGFPDVEKATYPKPNKVHLRQLIILICLLSASVLALITVLVLPIFISARRKRRMNSTDSALAIATAFGYIRRLASYEGIDSEIVSYGDFTREAIEKSQHLDAEFYEIVGIVLKCGFSREGATHAEAKRVALYSKRYAKKLYKTQNFFKKIKFTFVKHLN